MQAVKQKLATLKSKLDEAENNAKIAEDELQECNDKADSAEETVIAFFFSIRVITAIESSHT